jgi:hypothetical protein
MSSDQLPHLVGLRLHPPISPLSSFVFLTMSPSSKIKPNTQIDTQKKQTFKFRRSKVITTTVNKFVYLRGDMYGMNTSVATIQDALKNNVPVSHSGRTLADILSLSYPEELSSYKVERVVPGKGKEGTLVEYHRSEGDTKVNSFRSGFVAFLIPA